MKMQNDFDSWWAKNHPFDWWTKERGDSLPHRDRTLVWELCKRAFESATPSASVEVVDALQDLFNMVLYALESRDALLISKTCATMKKAEDALAAARGEQPTPSDEVKQRARAVKDLLGFLRVTPLKLNEEDAMTLSMLINAVTATDVEQEK